MTDNNNDTSSQFCNEHSQDISFKFATARLPTGRIIPPKPLCSLILHPRYFLLRTALLAPRPVGLSTAKVLDFIPSSPMSPPARAIVLTLSPCPLQNRYAIMGAGSILHSSCKSALPSNKASTTVTFADVAAQWSGVSEFGPLLASTSVPHANSSLTTAVIPFFAATWSGPGLD